MKMRWQKKDLKMGQPVGTSWLGNSSRYWPTDPDTGEESLLPYALACLEAALKLSEKARSTYAKLVELWSTQGMEAVCNEMCRTGHMIPETSAYFDSSDVNHFFETANYFMLIAFNKVEDLEEETPKITSERSQALLMVVFLRSLADHLGNTSVTSNSSGTVVDTVKYFPFGGTRSSTAPLDTDKLFTGQRLDQTGLYYYGARFYDATIGRFISPDSLVPDMANPQSLNRYSYCLNNPLVYTDPTGLDYVIATGSGQDTLETMGEYLTLLVGLGVYDATYDDNGDLASLTQGANWEPVYWQFDTGSVETRADAISGMISDKGLTNVKLIGFSEGAAAVGT
ncbi:MAG: RHS repeat-associated core domain-containing protein [Dehalococcoidia bacterium]|nr:RHS repeat-associated core domain-containing protein [Dehalococcoidia bacterium]